MNTPSGDIADRLLELAVERGALQYGDFTLSSGKKSAYYFDGRLLTLDPEGAHLIGNALLPLLTEAGVDAIGGPTLGADPIVTAAAMASWQQGTPLAGLYRAQGGQGLRHGADDRGPVAGGVNRRHRG